MENETLGSIRLGGSGLPIEVRILRKWIPRLREDDTCYLLVDQSIGAAASIDPLPNNEDLPRLYFEFNPYEDVTRLVGNKQRVIGGDFVTKNMNAT
ncbi:hypothetical protein R6Q59_011064 [Mikania micrantha]